MYDPWVQVGDPTNNDGGDDIRHKYLERKLGS